MALGMDVGLGPGDFVFHGDPATPRTEGTPTTTQFLAHVYCGKTVQFTAVVDIGSSIYNLHNKKGLNLEDTVLILRQA